MRQVLYGSYLLFLVLSSSLPFDVRGGPRLVHPMGSVLLDRVPLPYGVVLWAVSGRGTPVGEVLTPLLSL